MSQKTILILVDIAHQESAVELCHYAAALLPDSGELHLAYVLPYGNFSYVEPYVSADSLKASAKRAHDELGAIRHAVGIEANAHVLRGSIGEQALLLAKTISADLILLNAHRPGTQFHTLGSHAAQIMRHAECSVLVRR
jgi:universal stress protein F